MEVDSAETVKRATGLEPALESVRLLRRMRATNNICYELQPFRSEPLSIPLISSFRALLEEKGGEFRWATDPFKFFERHGASLVRMVMDASEGKGGNPHHVGRDPQVYNYLFMAANNSYVTEMLAKLQK